MGTTRNDTPVKVRGAMEDSVEQATITTDCFQMPPGLNGNCRALILTGKKDLRALRGFEGLGRLALDLACTTNSSKHRLLTHSA